MASSGPSFADALTAVFVLRPGIVSRNRHFALHDTPDAIVARRRASIIRGVVRQITGAFGPARVIELSASSSDYLLRFSLSKVALDRRIRLRATDLSVLRIALTKANVRLLPQALMPTPDDQRGVARLLQCVDETMCHTSGATA